MDVPSEYPDVEDSFIIGSGGGFTGEYNIFKVHSTGVVDKLDEESQTYKWYTEISTDSTFNYYEEFGKLNITSIDFNHPGNMTFFIEVNTEDGMHTVKWGDEKFQINKAVELFFEKMMTAIYEKER
ncbi:MAG: hypothetical protein HKN75_07230 [Bacteroidia bacterium]|nr:hypothetical protein [Bacteroidia bacterium]